MSGLSQLRWQDAVDVVVLTLVLYRIYLWLRGTVALQVAVGMLTLVAAAYAASELGLLLTAYLLQGVSAVSVLVIVVIFRDEIRRALTRASPLRLLVSRRDGPPVEHPELPPLAETLFELARRRLGSLVVVPRRDSVKDLVTGGVAVDAILTGPLIESIFQKTSPLHDGAVVVSGERIVKAGALLPLAEQELPLPVGTRHAAAVGLSEVSDALVIAVSEERGVVSLAEHGSLTIMSDAATLARCLRELVGPSPSPPMVHGRLVRDSIVFGTIFVGVIAAWNIVANARDAEEERQVAIEIRGPGAGRLEPVPIEVTLRLRGPRRILAGPGGEDLRAWVNVPRSGSDAQVGASAPPGVEIVAVRPARVKLQPARGDGDVKSPERTR